MTGTTHLDLPLLAAAQAQKHVTLNEALMRLDAVVQLSVRSRSIANPPASAGEGERWIVGATPAGAWAGRAGQVAFRLDGGWSFLEPRVGWLAWVEDEARLLDRAAAGFIDAASGADLSNVARLGVGSTADAANPLTMQGPNALFTAKPTVAGGSGDLRVKLNKEAATNVVSFLWQSGWSGRAEMGLVGADDFTLKVSPDGAGWIEAIRIDRTTGRIAFPAGVSDIAGTARSVERDLRLAALHAAELKGARVLLTAGIADAFADAAGVDAAASTDETYVPASRWYVASSGTMSLRSVAYAAAGHPSLARLAVHAESAGTTIALGTNLTALVSRDGGTTWSPVPLAPASTRLDGALIADGEAPLASQPAGTSMRWRVDAASGLRVRGVVLQWR